MSNENRIIVETEHTRNLHPFWHQTRRLVQTVTLLVPSLLKIKRKKIDIDETTLAKMTPEARKRYEDSLTIK